jgi:hypothetical protein
MVRISGMDFGAKVLIDNSAAVESFGEEAKMVYDQKKQENYWTTLMFICSITRRGTAYYFEYEFNE